MAKLPTTYPAVESSARCCAFKLNSPMKWSVVCRDTTSLKTTLKAHINEEAWASFDSDTSQPFLKPDGGKVAMKVNHLGG